MPHLIFWKLEKFHFFFVSEHHLQNHGHRIPANFDTAIDSCEQQQGQCKKSFTYVASDFITLHTPPLLSYILSLRNSNPLLRPAMAAAIHRLIFPSVTFVMALLSCFGGSIARLHYHKPNHHEQRRGMISEAPAEPPANTRNSSSDPCVFDVREFGAVGDGYTDDTESFLSAWRAACAADSGVLLVPSDGVFMITSTIFSGPCQPGFLFQVDGVLMPPDGPACWPKKDSKRQWLVFYRVDSMTLAGDGTIEGNGEEWWNLPCKPHRGPNGSTLPGPCYSPALIRFFMSSNLTIRDLSIQNSPQFHIKFDGCDGVLIKGLSINSPALSPNTDGIHLEDTKHVGIYDSMISNGDDCISIGPGCSDVDIHNVTCGPGHGISIGSLGNDNSEGCVSNVTVRNAAIRNSDNGVRIKTWQGGTGSVSGIVFDSVFMENVKNCIIIDQYYCLSKACRNQTSAVQVTDVVYANIKGTYDVRAPAIHFACSDAVPCTNISMSEVELLPFEGEMVEDPFCWNAYGEMQTATIPPMDCLQDGNPETLHDGGGGLRRCWL